MQAHNQLRGHAAEQHTAHGVVTHTPYHTSTVLREGVQDDYLNSRIVMDMPLDGDGNPKSMAADPLWRFEAGAVGKDISETAPAPHPSPGRGAAVPSAARAFEATTARGCRFVASSAGTDGAPARKLKVEGDATEVATQPAETLEDATMED
ncbi:MAG: hypothetical protein EOO65_05665 [Methanosarcinales archaeon]|nr:MAG: hypothetical protein EOO65_05665 [Methanosarcinales archaeon]